MITIVLVLTALTTLASTDRVSVEANQRAPASVNAQRRAHCDRGWVFYEKRCYSFSTSKELYANAVAYCTEKGSSLVEFEGPSDESWVWLQSRVRGFEVLWIGIVYSNINGTTEYVRLSTGNKAEYQNWDGEQKQNGNPAMCPALTNRITWMNYSCMHNKHYVCEKPA
eukprot:XP_011415554.1 PREDICTED: C-type lectin domain family 4 member M-like isoform X2 [Crassostrea gigas]